MVGDFAQKRSMKIILLASLLGRAEVLSCYKHRYHECTYDYQREVQRGIHYCITCRTHFLKKIELRVHTKVYQVSRFKAHNLQYENRLHFVGADAACAYRPPLLSFYQTTGCCTASAAQRYSLRRVLSPRGEKEILSCAERPVSKILHDEKLFLIMVEPATGGYLFQIGHRGTSISWLIIKQAMSLFQIIVGILLCHCLTVIASLLTGPQRRPTSRHPDLTI